MIKTIFLNKKNKEKIEKLYRQRYSEDNLISNIEKKVREIISKVKKEGDKALLEFTEKYDGVKLNPSGIMVSPKEWDMASQEVKKDLLEVIKEAINRIKKYHLNQKENSWFTTEEKGIILGQVINPIERAGLYIPGGTAAYPSSLIMAAVPAIIAGVKEIVVVTPPSPDGKINPYLLSTARELGILEIYKIGGAQAIAGLAYGTESIRRVDKIVGPGNIYVTLAKKNVFGEVDIDMLAGPSEILIWADEEANPRYLACDLLSQAEHDVEASAILITTSSLLADKVREEIENELKNLKRKEIIQESLKKKGKLIVAEDEEIILEFINNFAPEHLELQIENPWQILGEIKNAGAIFVGAYSPEPLGDYWAGPNHILPTSGGARCFSPLSVADFTKKSSIIFYDKKNLRKDGQKIASLARLEGLEAHARSIEIRKGEKIKSDYLFQKNIILNKKILDRISQVDTLVFDIDGVLIDVQDSFKKAVCQTVQFYFKEILHFQGSQNLINPEQVEYFKMAGGFNNDWNLTSAVVLFYLMKAEDNNLKNIDELRSNKPDIKTFTTRILPPGGGLGKVVDLVEKNWGTKGKIFNRWDKELITKIFKEIYAGEEHCFDIYGFNPSLIKAEGLIEKEKIIIDKNKKDFLQNFSLGILTGRNKREARVALERLGWDDILFKEKIVTADDGAEKPHSQGLKKIANSLKTKLGIYIGDTRDDMITVKNFNKEVEPTATKFLSAIVLGAGFNLRSKSVKFYLNEEVDLLARDVNYILDWLKGIKSSR